MTAASIRSIIGRLAKSFLLVTFVGVSAAAHADIRVSPEGSPVSADIFGFAFLDYTYGNQIPDGQGNDRIGISKAAFGSKIAYKNWDLTSVLGATVLSDGTTDVGFKDIFITWNDVGGSKAKLIGGAQAFLFGLKPNGYPGDRTLQPSVEFGGAGGFAVSNQAGASLRAIHPVSDWGTVEVLAFDTNISAGPGTGTDGSAIYKNWIGQLRVDKSGVKGVVGVEGRYVGGTVNGIRPIVDIGLGYEDDAFDITAEYIWLHSAISQSQATPVEAGHETYVVVEGTWRPTSKLGVLGDYSWGHRLKAHTARFGITYALFSFVELRAEYAHDFLGAGRTDNKVGTGRVAVRF